MPFSSNTLNTNPTSSNICMRSADIVFFLPSLRFLYAVRCHPTQFPNFSSLSSTFLYARVGTFVCPCSALYSTSSLNFSCHWLMYRPSFSNNTIRWGLRVTTLPVMYFRYCCLERAHQLYSATCSVSLLGIRTCPCSARYVTSRAYISFHLFDAAETSFSSPRRSISSNAERAATYRSFVDRDRSSAASSFAFARVNSYLAASNSACALECSVSASRKSLLALMRAGEAPSDFRGTFVVIFPMTYMSFFAYVIGANLKLLSYFLRLRRFVVVGVGGVGNVGMMVLLSCSAIPAIVVVIVVDGRRLVGAEL
mmetsp:Transcript_16339/g.39099  ORF Transcript_16339/g.39099 Transcript_16339/m.39099 type:complete len:310 (+) Transcript_16339:305-1234(+)